MLVEYPLARSAKAARELFQLAEDKGYCVKVENLVFFFFFLVPNFNRVNILSSILLLNICYLYMYLCNTIIPIQL